EGKGILFKAFADIDVFDLEVGSEDPEDMIRFCRLLEQADGEMQADTAVVERLLTRTYPFSTLRAPANVLIFPNLDAANISYKLLSRVGGAEAIGPILVRMAQPVRVLQRGSDVNDIVNMAVIAAVDAQEHGRRSRA